MRCSGRSGHHDERGAVLAQAAASGSLPAALDLDAAVSALFGARWYRLLPGEPLDDADAAALGSPIRIRA